MGILPVIVILTVQIAQAVETNKHSTDAKLKELHDHVAAREDQIKLLKEELHQQRHSFEARLSILEQRVERKMVTPIAFTAVDAGGWHFVDTGNPLVFNTTITNIGNSFDPVTSRFTCPLTGTYYFSFRVYAQELLDAGTSYRDTSFWELVMNDDGDIAEARAETGGDLGYISVTSSADAVLYCEAGSQVWVRSMTSFSNVYSEVTAPTASFTGFMLYAN